MNIKYIYLKSPRLLKFLIINIYSYYLKIIRYNKSFYSNLKVYNNTDYLAKHCFEIDLFNNQIKDNEHYKVKSNLLDYKISNKKYIKENYDSIINKKYIYQYLFTSGTTGSGLKFPVSKEFINHQWAIFWNFRNRHNIKLNTWCAYFMGQPILDLKLSKSPYWFKSYPLKQIIFSQYHINKDTVDLYLKKISDSKLKWIHGYPSTLNYLVNLARKKEINGLSDNIEVITCSSEKLFDYQRSNIENFFNCKIRDLYGLTEGVVNISECEEGIYHIDENYSYVELIKIEDTDEYKIIGTSYYNKAFPLVRYHTGDTCTLYDSDFKCICGRKSRVVKEIIGRDEDYLILKSGLKIGRLDHLFKNIFDVIESQIFQEKSGYAEFRIVKDTNYSSSTEKKLINEIKEKLGDDFKYDIVYYDRIPRTPNGKIKFVINKI